MKLTSIPALCCMVLLAMIQPAAAINRVIVDAGHGGKDEGTKWYGISEKKLTLEIAKRLTDVLRAKGIDAQMTRQYDAFVPLDNRWPMASQTDTLLVSLHFNASRLQGVSGFEVFHYHSSPSSALVARSIHTAMKEKLMSTDRGVKPQDFALLARTTGMAVLVECGFISNRVEAHLYASPVGQQQLAETLALGIMRVAPVVNKDDPAQIELAQCLTYYNLHKPPVFFRPSTVATTTIAVKENVKVATKVTKTGKKSPAVKKKKAPSKKRK